MEDNKRIDPEYCFVPPEIVRPRLRDKVSCVKSNL